MTLVRTRLLNVVLLAALALAAARLSVFLRELPPTLPASVADEPAAQSPVEGPAGREPHPAAPANPENYDVIVARNLFSPTRGVVAPAPTSGIPAPKPQPAPKLTLFGVVIVDGERSAFLQEGTQEAKPRKVRENEQFAGGTVGAIRADGLTFLFAGQEITVPLRTPKVGLPALPAAGPGSAAPVPVRTPMPAQRRPGRSGLIPTPIPSPMSRVPVAESPEDADGGAEEEYFPENPFDEEDYQEASDETLE